MELDGRDWLGQARRGVIELCVLALIRSEPRYGYQLVTALAELGRPLAASEGTLYPLLRRLQREGLVDATWQESPDGPPRKYYHLSESGARLLEAELAEWDQLTSAIAKLAPLAVMSHESRVASYAEARSVVEAELTTHDSRPLPETRDSRLRD